MYRSETVIARGLARSLPTCLVIWVRLMPNDHDSPSNVRDHLANERTLLSWLRLSMAITALGFVVARFGVFVAQLAIAQGLRVTETGLSVPVGVALVLLGPLFAVLALLRFRTAEQEIDEGRLRAHHGL